MCIRDRIQLGGAFAVEPNVFGTIADYVSLGHLHRPQQVSACQVPCRYSGSPMEYSFSEAGQQKEVVIVEVIPEKRRSWPREPHSFHEEMHLDKSHGVEGDNLSTAFRLERIPLSCGKPLKRYRASLSLIHISWYCIAFCHERRQVRIFALDRIGSIKMTAVSYTHLDVYKRQDITFSAYEVGR